MLLGALILSGCATNLTLEKDGDLLAQAAGVPRESIRLARVCFVMTVRPKGIEPEKGNYYAVVVAPNAVHFLEIDAGWNGERPKNKGFKIEYSDMEGVDLKRDSRLFPHQLQVLCAENIYVIMDYREWDTVISPPNPAYSDQIFQIIREHGVPRWESNTWYSSRELVPPGGSDLRY